MNYIKKQSKPKISVIMSVYNGLPYIKEAVNSVLGQTYKSFEFVIVDDASIDDSWKYLKSLKDKRIRLLKNKKNIGLAASLNSALKAAKGDYIARMDADDISLPKRFETQLKFLESHPEVDLCGTWVNIIDPKGKKIGEKKYSTSSKKIKKILSFYSSIIHPTFMGKKEYFIKLGGYTSKYDFAEDYDLLMRGRSIFTMANIPKILLSWRYQNNRRSRSDMKKMYRIDLKIKKDSLKRDGFDILTLLGIFKMILVNTFIPESLKLKIAILLKIA